MKPKDFIKETKEDKEFALFLKRVREVSEIMNKYIKALCEKNEKEIENLKKEFQNKYSENSEIKTKQIKRNEEIKIFENILNSLEKIIRLPFIQSIEVPENVSPKLEKMSDEIHNSIVEIKQPLLEAKAIEFAEAIKGVENRGINIKQLHSEILEILFKEEINSKSIIYFKNLADSMIEIELSLEKLINRTFQTLFSTDINPEIK